MPPKTRSKNPTVPSVDNTQPKRCGGQKGILATEHDDNVPNNSPSTEEPPVRQQSKKRSHQAAAIQGNVEDAPPAKKGKKVNNATAANGSLVDKPNPELTRPARVRKPATAISNTQDIPKWRRRTKEEVAADKEKIATAKEAKHKAAEELIRKAEEAKAISAQMNIDEEQADARMENENPCRLSAVKHKHGRAQVEESEGESFDEVASSSEDTDSEMEIVVSIPEINTFVH